MQRSSIKLIAVTAALMCGPYVVLAGPQSTPPKEDNTAVNKRDRSSAAVTADKQKENATDRELAAKVRKALTTDKSLSTYAHNVKVVSQNGTVTLKGPVRSESEKSAIEAKAKEIAGADNVANEISIAPGK